jgi:hypothetical protein
MEMVLVSLPDVRILQLRSGETPLTSTCIRAHEACQLLQDRLVFECES